MMSEATEIADTDFEDESDYERAGSFESVSVMLSDCLRNVTNTSQYDSRRRSQTTISSYDEARTPSPRTSTSRNQFNLRLQPVEGPKGPHLFRASQASVEYFDYALQMSPVLVKEEPEPFSRVPSAFSEDTVTRYPLEEIPYQPEAHDPEAHIRSWSTQEVIDWMLEIGCDASVIECFENHDINGTVLVDLDFDDLKELDIQSFGKRHALWNAICLLRGEDGIPSPQPTPFQDISRPCTSNSRQSPSNEWRADPVTPSDTKRRGRKEPRAHDVVTPEQSVSIVAIEQLLPKPHKCAKGERCAKWRKQQRELQQLHDEHGIGRFPISPTKGGHIFVAGDPGNASTADNMMPFQEPHHNMEDPFRPNSEAKLSVIASSGLLTPGQLPHFALQEDTLNQLGSRDPQDNVKRFLHYQHMNSPTHSPASGSPTTETAPPVSPPLEMFPSNSISPFPAQYHEAPAILSQQLRTLPRLDIPGPRSASAGPQLHHRSSPMRQQPLRQQTAPSSLSQIQNTTSASSIYRHGTPSSEVDVPMTPTNAVLDRDTSQSVPPNMQFRNQHHAAPSTPSRSNSSARDWRRPSMHTALPAVREHEVLTTVRDPAHHSPVSKNFGYGPECTHSGWMRKRKTKLLRHEWNDAHFRLKGTQLGMHGDAKLESRAKEVIDVDGYAVACSSVASQGKLRAGLKAFAMKSPEKKVEGEAAAFSFQLVPQQRVEGKTHHFAVSNKDERIDWMRELMLAKALKQKKEGYEVEINGVQVE